MTEKQYEQMIIHIGNIIQEFLPEESELTVCDGVEILYSKYKILEAEKTASQYREKLNSIYAKNT